MNHLFILLVICFLLQSLGLFSLQKNLGRVKQEKNVKIALNAILVGIIIQLTIIIFQLYLNYFVVHIFTSIRA